MIHNPEKLFVDVDWSVAGLKILKILLEIIEDEILNDEKTI